MPVPKRKTSKSRRDKRNASKGLKVKSFAGCSNCSAPITGHQACGGCGFYKGKKVLETKADRALKRGEANRQKSEQQAAASKASNSPSSDVHTVEAKSVDENKS